ncbi:MAG: ShlB/FhaC/HecB family hemolysin secretion/activation protein [Gammaproteobacteria bacterium]|nr:ShlB/FhaC/HecB family hemolysin secretion/activation protein [Gammaproteobacteria bacterium]
MTDSPGIGLQALFTPGEKTGGSILKLNTTREKRFNTGLWLDNYGSEFTGSYRLRVSSTVNNLSNSADYLTVTLLKTFSPSNSTYYALDYERPLNRWDTYLGFDISNNGFEVGQEFEALRITGDSRSIGMRLRKMFMRQRDRNLFTSFALHQKNATSEQAGRNIGEDKLTVVSLALHYNGDSRWLLRGNHSGEVRYSQGLPDVLGAMDSEGNGASSRRGSSDERMGGDFSKINLQYTHWYPLQKNQVIKIQYRGQFSSDLLSSIEQTALGGPGSVRGYPVSEVLFDSSTIINLEWQARSAQIEEELAWLKNFQFGAYYDFATGKRNQVRDNERETATLRSIGGFAEFQPFGKFQARFDLAFPQGGDEPVNGDSFQLYFSLGRIF